MVCGTLTCTGHANDVSSEPQLQNGVASLVSDSANYKKHMNMVTYAKIGTWALSYMSQAFHSLYTTIPLNQSKDTLYKGIVCITESSLRCNCFLTYCLYFVTFSWVICQAHSISRWITAGERIRISLSWVSCASLWSFPFLKR